jgi:hypothetical protein
MIETLDELREIAGSNAEAERIAMEMKELAGEVISAAGRSEGSGDHDAGS